MPRHSRISVRQYGADNLSPRRALNYLELLLALFSFVIAARAQTATATLKGLVEDAGGQVVPGATISLTQLTTGLKRTFTTDVGGQYVFALLEPGAYAVEAQAAGVRVPDQLAVTGFGNLRMAGDMRPTITSVDIDGARIAREVLRVLRARATRTPVETRIDVGFRVIARESA